MYLFLVDLERNNGFSRRLWNHNLPLPDRCKLARYMWVTEDVTLNNKRQHVFDWIIKTLTNNEKELLAEEYRCIWTLFVEIIRLPDEELGLLQAYVIPLTFMKIFCRTLRSISADVSGPIDSILLECAHLLINAGSRTHLLINNHNLMFGIVKKALECATHSLCEHTQMNNNVLALLKSSISMALVTQRQNTEYLKIFSYVMAELLELSLTYFYLADELNDTSHLEREVIEQIQNCSQTLQQLLHNVIFHSDFYASHKIYIDKKHEREVKGEMFLGAKKKRGVEMLDNFYCKLGEWCRDTSNTTRHKSTLHYISMYITQYYTVYKSDPTMLNYDIMDFLCSTCLHINPSPDVEVEDLGAKYVEQHPDDVDFEKNIESDGEEEESLEPVTKKLRLEGSTNTENMLGDLWVNETVNDDTFYELLPENAEVASMDSDNTIQVNYTITDDVFESFLQLLKSTCLQFLPPDEAWYSKIVGWLLNQPKRNILFFKCLSVILSRGYVGFAKRLNSVLNHTWISKNELTNDSVVYQDNFLSELLSTYVQLRQLPVLIGKMLESLSKAQKLNVVLDSKMLWHQQFEQKLCENFLQLPQTTFIKVWGAINGALHKIAHRNNTGSLITVAPFCHLLSMLLSAISIVDLNITQSTRDSARQHLKMFNAEIISKLIQKTLLECSENLPSLVELYWTCSELETLLNHYIAGDSNPIKFTRHNDDINDDGFSLANLHPGIEKELWDNLLIHSENDKQLLYQITMMTFHGLRSQLLSQATNSEFINACTEWLCKQCLLQTTSTMTPRGVKDTWDKRSFSISAHNSHIAQFYLFCSNVPLMAEVLNQKQQTTFAQLLLQCRLTEETDNCMTLGSISADFLQSTTLQELPTIQCAIINAVITETCSTMELKSHDLRSNIPTNSPMISAYQKLLESLSDKHCTDMSELSVHWHKNAFVDESHLICRNQEIYARLQHYNQIISTLPIEYLQTHEINCCQFYYLFVLCTTNANLKEGPSMRSTHWDAANALSHASWEGFSKMIDISGTCVVEMVDFQQQLKFLEFFYSNISYNWKGVNFTERIVGTAIQNGQHLNEIQTFIENICPEVKSTKLNENVLQSVVSQCNFVLNSVTKITLGSPHCGIQTSLITLSHKLTSLITQHFSIITKNMDIYCNVLLAYQNVLLGKMLDSKNKKCFPKIVQGAVDVINDIQSSNLECIEYSASLLTCVCDEWEVCGKFMKDDFLFKLYKILQKQLKLAYVEEQKQEGDMEDTEGDHSTSNNSVDDSLKRVTLAVLSKIPTEMYSTILEQALQDVNPIDVDINNLIVTLRLWLLLVQKLRIVDCREIVHKSIAKILLKVSVIVGSHKCVDSAHDVHLLLVCYELQQEIVLTKIQDHIPDCMTAVTFNGLSLNFCEMNGREFVSLFTSIIKFTKKYMKRWPQNLNSLTPTYMAVVKSLLEGIMHHGDQSRVNENNYTEIISCARLMTSLCKRISENKLQFKKVAFHLIVEYIYNIKKVTLHADVKECLLYAMYAILTLADKSTVKHLLVVLPTNLTYVFRNIQQDYEKYHRFKGEI